MADVQKLNLHRRAATHEYLRPSENNGTIEKGPESSKKFLFPQLNRMPVERKLEICALLDQLTNNGPIRQPEGLQGYATVNNSPRKRNDSFISTARNSYRPKQLKEDQTSGAISTLKIEPNGFEGTKSNNQSPECSSSSRGFKLNIWGGSNMIEGHKRSTSFDTMVR